MVLDSLTILFALAPLSLMVGLGLYVVWLRDRAEPGLLLWSISLMLRFPAFLLISARGTIPDFLSIAVANFVLFLAVGVGIKATRALGRRATPLAAVLAPATLWLVLCCVPAIYADDQNRLIAVTLLQAGGSLVIAFEFQRSVVGSRKVALALSGLITAMAMVQFVRLGFVITSPEPILLQKPNAPLAATIYLQLIAVFVGGLAAIAMFLEVQLKDLRRLATEDSLTGALTRDAFQSRVEAGLQDAFRAGEPAELLAIDLDRFKALNDAHGHAEGDRVLALFGLRLRALLPEDALFGRVGGDEFVVFLRGPAIARVSVLAGNICGLLGRGGCEPEFRGAPGVTASVGRARAEQGEAYAALLARADAALYLAKRNGREQVGIAAAPGARVQAVTTDVARLAGVMV